MGVAVAAPYTEKIQYVGEGPNSGDGIGSFNTSETYTVQTDSSGVYYTKPKTFIGLRVGRWTFTVATDTWSTSCTKTLTKGQSPNYYFTYGVSSCGTNYP